MRVGELLQVDEGEATSKAPWTRVIDLGILGRHLVLVFGPIVCKKSMENPSISGESV